MLKNVKNYFGHNTLRLHVIHRSHDKRKRKLRRIFLYLPEITRTQKLGVPWWHATSWQVLGCTTETPTLSQIYPHWNSNSKWNTKLRLEFQFEYGFKLEFQVELLIRRESVGFFDVCIV